MAQASAKEKRNKPKLDILKPEQLQKSFILQDAVYARSRISVSFPCVNLKNKGKFRTSKCQMKRTKAHAFSCIYYNITITINSCTRHEFREIHMYKHAGQNFPLSSNSDILTINSPRNMIKGPYYVVYKNEEERWVIVFLRWDNKPRLGIRWFYGNEGTPSVRGYATWLIIPNELTESILNGLPLTPQLRHRIHNDLLK